MERHIVGLGGTGTEQQSELLWKYVLDVVGKTRPRLLFVPTASGDNETYAFWFYERFARRAEVSTLLTFPYPPEHLREVVLEQDAICVGGGNTANMLALWRLHGIDTLMREAWENGVVLWGSSAGMICWFEAGVTDSFGPHLDGMDCLGFLSGSACPHYDGEEQRRPRYRELVDNGFPEGVAADDGVALHYVGTELSETVTCRDGAAAYRVTRGGEERLPARVLE